MPDLICYRLRVPPEGFVTTFDDAIDESALDDLTTAGPVDVGGARAKLYIAPSIPHAPEWAGTLQVLFRTDLIVPPIAGAGALVIVEYVHVGASAFLAFAFGYGWRLMRPESFQRGFGLKACLNIVFEGDTGSGEWDPARLRSVDSKRVGSTVLRARHQVSGTAALEDLDVNIRRDLVNGVTGIPAASDVWGTRVTGRDALQFSWPSLNDLGELCRHILLSYEGEDYKIRFSFIDDFVGVADPVARTRLQEEVLGMLTGGDLSRLDIAPPELIDWERVVGFQYHTERRGNPVTRLEIRLQDYLTTLSQASQLASLSIEKLKNYIVYAKDGDGKDVARWSLWRCLYGEVELEGQTIVLDDGNFYQVSEDYLNILNTEISSLPECELILPDWKAGWHEDDYNRFVSQSSADYLLLDKKLVRVASHTNRVELCDILSSNGCFIHVKKKGDGSASLSHLFNQGFVSANLAVGSSDFRRSALELISDLESARAEAEGDDSFKGRFRPFGEDAAIASSCEVVFAIFSDSENSAIDSLPFFSKITLRNMADELRRRGFRVSVKCITRSL